MQDHPTNKKSDEIHSKNIKPREDETKIDLQLGKTKFIILKKPLSFPFLALVIVIVLFALGGVIFEIVSWRSISPNIDKTKMDISPHNLNKVSSKPSKRLSFDTTVTSYGKELNENHHDKQGSLSTYVLFDGTDTPEEGSTMTSVEDLFTAFGNSYESTAERFLGTFPATIATEQRKGQFCEEVRFSSSRIEKERYPNLFGVYGAIGMIKDNFVYKHKNTNSFLLKNLHHNHIRSTKYRIGTKKYETQWVFLSQDYVSFDLLCEDLIGNTNSKCTPKWHLCTVDTQLSNSLHSEVRSVFGSYVGNCSVDETALVQCNEDKVETKLIEEEDKEQAPVIEDSSLHQNDTDSDFICEEIEFSSGKVQESHPILGIYSIEDYHYENKVVYVNKQTGVYLYYSIRLYNSTTFNFSTKSLIHTNTARGSWVIGYSFDHSNLLADNQFCSDTDLPLKGDCDIGWFFKSDMAHASFTYDNTASIACKTPTPIENITVDKPKCTTFELTTTNEAFNEGYLVAFLGEYEKMNTSDNGKFVYHRFDPITMKSLYLYSSISSTGTKSWRIGHEIGSRLAYICNIYCVDLEYQVTEECNHGWYYVSQEARSWVIDFSMSIHCADMLG